MTTARLAMQPPCVNTTASPVRQVRTSAPARRTIPLASMPTVRPSAERSKELDGSNPRVTITSRKLSAAAATSISTSCGPSGAGSQVFICRPPIWPGLSSDSR